MEAEIIVGLVVPMKDLRCEIEAIRPDDGSCVSIDSDLGEVVGIIEGSYQP